jgi:hypothetical protein
MATGSIISEGNSAEGTVQYPKTKEAINPKFKAGICFFFIHSDFFWVLRHSVLKRL